MPTVTAVPHRSDFNTIILGWGGRIGRDLVIQMPPASAVLSNDSLHSLPRVKPASRKAWRVSRKDLPTFFF